MKEIDLVALYRTPPDERPFPLRLVPGVYKTPVYIIKEEQLNALVDKIDELQQQLDAIDERYFRPSFKRFYT